MKSKIKYKTIHIRDLDKFRHEAKNYNKEIIYIRVISPSWTLYKKCIKDINSPPASKYFKYYKETLHREDGPAIIDVHNEDNHDYYLNDVLYSKKDYYKELYNRGLITKEEAILEIL